MQTLRKSKKQDSSCETQDSWQNYIFFQKKTSEELSDDNSTHNRPSRAAKSKKNKQNDSDEVCEFEELSDHETNARFVYETQDSIEIVFFRSRNQSYFPVEMNSTSTKRGRRILQVQSQLTQNLIQSVPQMILPESPSRKGRSRSQRKSLWSASMNISNSEGMLESCMTCGKPWVEIQ